MVLSKIAHPFLKMWHLDATPISSLCTSKLFSPVTCMVFHGGETGVTEQTLGLCGCLRDELPSHRILL